MAMFGSAVLEVAIGLTLVYLLFSLVCSAINEFIARLLKWRSKTLEDGIKSMLGDLEIGGGQLVKDKIYNTPLFKGLIGKGKAWTGRDIKPTYIPSRTFALALLDVVAPSQKDKVDTFDSVRAKVGSLHDTGMKQSLLGLLDSAEGDLKRARENIERWFDESMDQVTAWYKRTANTWLFIVSVLVCAIMNADSVAVGTTLWRDPSLRAAVVNQAEKTAKKPEEIDKALQQLKVPIGWTSNALKDLDSFEKWAEKIVGLLFTGIAVSLGAPFWFDMLNKLVNFRTGGNKPEKTPAVEPLTPPPQRLEIIATAVPPAALKP